MRIVWEQQRAEVGHRLAAGCGEARPARSG